METTHGDYGGAGPLFDFLGISKSILPMNINVRFWGDAFGPRAKLEVPLNNIRAGATILSGIIANLPAAASVAEIATLSTASPPRWSATTEREPRQSSSRACGKGNEGARIQTNACPALAG